MHCYKQQTTSVCSGMSTISWLSLGVRRSGALQLPYLGTSGHRMDGSMSDSHRRIFSLVECVATGGGGGGDLSEIFPFVQFFTANRMAGCKSNEADLLCSRESCLCIGPTSAVCCVGGILHTGQSSLLYRTRPVLLYHTVEAYVTNNRSEMRFF